MIERLRAQPGVTDAAAAIGLPLVGPTRARRTASAGRPVLPLPQRPLAGLDDRQRRLLPADADRASPRGAPFTADDREGAPNVCIVNESLARRLFPGESALGKILLRGRDAEIRARSSA